MLARSDQLECFRSNYLNLFILPTEACNFRCTYCYETFEHKKMSRRVVNGIKALIDRRGGELDELEISWFGGEPLTAFDIVSDISQHAVATARSLGFRFRSNITTNGYLLDQQRFSRCLENGITFFQISLDGPPNEHNASRQLASGAGTFDRIWANLLAMKQVPGDCTILLRLHYTYENYMAVGHFARTIGEALGDDPRFGYYFRHIARLGGSNDESIKQMSSQERKHIEAQLWQASGLPRTEDSAVDQDYICYAAKGNSLVVRSTGRLAKCTVALNDSFNDIGSIKEDGDIAVDQERFRRWIRPVLEANWDVVGCPLYWVTQQAKLDQADHSAAAV
jgi:uncharacterized protein